MTYIELIGAFLIIVLYKVYVYFEKKRERKRTQLQK